MKSSRIVIAIIVIILVGVGIYFAFRQNEQGGQNVNTEVTNVNTTNTNTEANTSRTTTPLNKNSQAYQAAVTEFEGKRLQFDNCVATIPLVGATFKNGTRIMLEGKSPDPQIITIDGKEYTLSGFDYTFVTLQSSTLPKTI